MSTSPSNLKLALDAYDAQQRRQAALIEAQRIGTLIHIQEQQLLAAKHLAKQRRSQRRRSSNSTTSTTTASQPSESAIEDEEEEVLLVEPVISAPAPICPSLAARRASRSAAKRASLLPPNPVLESIPEPEHEPQESCAQEQSTGTSNVYYSPIARWASHTRRPQEPYAALASRSQWKPDSQARFCDNTLCKKPFTLFGPKSRHHCRRCGNVFCASCLSHTEVLYDMARFQWDTIPEQLLSSIFHPGPSPAEYPQQIQPDQERRTAAPTSPASFTSTNLSSSIESGSSRASTSSSSYFTIQPSLRQPVTDPLHTVQRTPLWSLGSDKLLPSPVPAEWRDQLLDIASEEKVCEECHDELWDQATPVERHYARRAFNREREEMAWALSVVGLEQWDEILRKHDLTLKPSPRERKEEKKARRGSSSTATTTSSTQSRASRHPQPWSFPTQGDEIPTGFAPGVKPEEGLDFLDRPTYPHLYAWVTSPPCIRFTSSAFKPPAPAPSTPSHTSPAPTPSPFGMLKSPAKFLPPPLPASYLAAHLPAAAHVPSGEEREEIRHERYTAAVGDLVKTAYRKGVPCDHLDGGVMRVRYVVEPSPLEVWKTEMEGRVLDLAARWRGDPVAC